MALLNRFMSKSVLGTDTVDELTLEPDTGRSILIKDILTCPESDRYLNVKISKTLVGYFRIDTVDLGSHLSDIIAPGIATKEPTVPPYRSTILKQMADAGIFKGYPISEGEKLVLTHDDGGNLGNTVVVYEEYEAGDITSDMQNGTEADEYVYINYGRFETAPAAAGSFVYDNQVTPVEFPEFPFGKVVPANKSISVNALLASDRNIISATDGLATTYYSFKQGRMTMFDEDLRGILAAAPTAGLANNVLCEEGACLLGEGSHLYRRPVYFFEDPLVFEAGEELNVYATFIAGGAAAGAIDLVQSEIALIQTVKEMV